MDGGAEIETIDSSLFRSCDVTRGCGDVRSIRLERRSARPVWLITIVLVAVVRYICHRSATEL